MMSSNKFFVACSTIALMAAFATTGHAQSSEGFLLAQMHGGGAQGQGHGSQGQGTQSQDKGMGMGKMESRGTGDSTAQTPASSGCMDMCMGGQAMQGEMGGMGMSSMPGPRMMQQMMMQGRMADLPSDRIEGRIAYLHAELRITDAQMPTWNDFAAVLRANAKRASDARPASTPTASQPVAAAVRLDEQERWLAARLESVRALKPAYTKLYAALDDSQKKTADELLASYLGVR